MKKITISNEEVKFLVNMIAADNRVAIDMTPTEPDIGWRSWVMAPLAQHAITPREAKAVLTVVGILADYGIPVDEIMNIILETFVKNYND